MAKLYKVRCEVHGYAYAYVAAESEEEAVEKVGEGEWSHYEEPVELDTYDIGHAEEADSPEDYGFDTDKDGNILD